MPAVSLLTLRPRNPSKEIVTRPVLLEAQAEVQGPALATVRTYFPPGPSGVPGRVWTGPALRFGGTSAIWLKGEHRQLLDQATSGVC
jgi:hypothetical protein